MAGGENSSMRKQEDGLRGNDLALLLFMVTVVWLWGHFR